VIGAVLGGVRSLGFALEHPQMTRALVICDSGSRLPQPGAREAWNAGPASARYRSRRGAWTPSARAARSGNRASLHRSAQGLAHAARGMLAQEGSR